MAIKYIRGEFFKKLDNVSKPKESIIKETKIVPIIVKKTAPKKPLKVIATQTSKIYHRSGCITVKGKKNLVNFKNPQANLKKEY
jgi:hypothetical protein